MRIRIYSILVIAALLAILIPMNWAGVCYSRGRTLSDQEFFVEALRYVQRYDDFPEKLTSDLEAKRYLARNPDCCSIARGRGFPIIDPDLSRLLGMAEVAIEIRYRKKVPDKEGAFYVVDMAMPKCGGWPSEVFGMAYHQLPSN